VTRAPAGGVNLAPEQLGRAACKRCVPAQSVRIVPARRKLRPGGTSLAGAEPMAKFLVVDDDPSTVHAMSRLLRDEGHEVSRFTRGVDAIDALAREPFDAVVADLEMPHTDGHAVVRAARRHAPAACLVVTTVGADPAPLHAEGVCAVHQKPIVFDALVATIRECRAHSGPGAGGACPLRSPGGRDRGA
jgi:CheY-like chemotaxis protein